MRHRHGYNKLTRNSSHRRMTLRNMVTSLIEHGRIETTLPKAKAIRPLAEKMITLAKRDTLHTRRQAAAYLTRPLVVKKLFADIGPKFADRPGGYTRIVRLGFRQGDGGAIAQIHLIGSEFKGKPKKEKKKKTKDAPPEEPVADDAAAEDSAAKTAEAAS